MKKQYLRVQRQQISTASLKKTQTASARLRVFTTMKKGLRQYSYPRPKEVWGKHKNWEVEKVQNSHHVKARLMFGFIAAFSDVVLLMRFVEM